MDNPIVVFVVPDQFGTVLTDKMTGTAAAGVTECGRLEQAKHKNCYALLFLDDTKDVPASAPCMIDNNRPLLIVVHNNSELNRGPWNKPLCGNASPVICKTFSHRKGDPVFDSVRGLLNDNTDQTQRKEIANFFVKSCNVVSILEALDGLATICQIDLLLPQGDQQPDRDRLFDLRDGFRFRFPKVDNDDYLDLSAKCQLSLLQKTAGDLLQNGA